MLLVLILLKKILKNNYDLVIYFGEAPLFKDTIKIELIGNWKDVYKTSYDYSELVDKLRNNGYNVIISEDAGNYLCNNLYYNGLKFLYDNNMNAKMIFIHIPKINNISNINNLVGIFN